MSEERLVELTVDAGAPESAPGPVAAAASIDGMQEAVQAAAVSQEELDRLTVREGISDAERAQLYMAGGQAVQQLAVIENLPGLLRAAGRAAFPPIARALAEATRQLDSEGQMAAADAYAAVARERLLPAAELADWLLPLVLAGVGDGGHPGAQAAWLACLGELAAGLGAATLRARVLPAVAARGGGAGHTLRERCLCCALLGALAPHVGGEDLQRTLLRLGAALCQDTEWQVRHAACQQLPALAAAAADKLVEASLEQVLVELFDLLEDEEALVRAAAWRSLPACLGLLPTRLRRTRVLPLLLRQCRDPEHHAEVHRSLTAGLGLLMTRLVADMEGDAEVAACLAYFRSQACRHDHATRLNCAVALPLVLRAGTARRYGSHLHDSLLRLAGDGDPGVRAAVAAGLPEVAALLGRDRCCQYLRQPVAALLQDAAREVQAAALQRLPQVLEQFCLGLGEEARAKALAAFVDPLLRLDAGAGCSWRLQLALLLALPAFPAFFSPDQLHDRFLPLVWRHMGEGAAAVRGAAAAAVAALWRALRKPSHRTGVFSRAIHEFAQSKSCRQRMIFLDFCRAVQRHFSSKFVKAHLLEAALTLAYDPVANVRLAVAAAMPTLKQCLALPGDVHLLERLNSGMSHLITDGDADVRRQARQANEDFKLQPVRMSCGALEGSPPWVKELEAADAARAEAEHDFQLDPDQLERILADVAAYDEQLRPAHARLPPPLPPAAADGGARQRPGPAHLAGGAAARQPVVRASPEAAEAKRGRGALASSRAGRSALAREQQQRASGSEDRAGRAGGGPAGGSRLAPQSPGAAGGTQPTASGCGAQQPPSLAAAEPAVESPAGEAATGTQQQQPAAQPIGGDPPLCSRQSAGAAAKPAVPALKPSKPAASKRQPSGAPLLALPPAMLPAAAAAAAAAGAPARAAPAAASGGGAQRRPGQQGTAGRAVAEVQQLALRLRSAIMYGDPAAATSQPRQGSSAAGAKAAGSAPFGGGRPAEGRPPAGGGVAAPGGGALAVGVRGISGAARGGPA